MGEEEGRKGARRGGGGECDGVLKEGGGERWGRGKGARGEGECDRVLKEGGGV